MSRAERFRPGIVLMLGPGRRLVNQVLRSEGLRDFGCRMAEARSAIVMEFCDGSGGDGVEDSGDDPSHDVVGHRRTERARR
jgi:hypothetical protein